MQRRTHSCLNIEGFLRNSQFPDDFDGIFSTDGRPMSASEAHHELTQALRRGHHVMPLNSFCANPCKRQGCVGFNFGKNGGCPGYQIEDVPSGEAK